MARPFNRPSSLSARFERRGRAKDPVKKARAEVDRADKEPPPCLYIRLRSRISFKEIRPLLSKFVKFRSIRQDGSVGFEIL